MIERKADRTEDARTFFAYLIGEPNKSKTSEDEFLEEGVAYRNIESDKDEVVLRYADFIE